MQWVKLPLLVLPLALGACLPGLKQAPVEAPPQLIVAQGETLLHVTIPKHKAAAAMKKIGEKGSTSTWMSADAYTLSLDRGIVVASRGFGYDLMGASAEATYDAIRQDESLVYRRQWRYLTSDNQSSWLQAGCQTRRHGLVDGLRHVSESCTAGADRFTNHYWLSAQDEVLRSEQWISPEIGLVQIKYTKHGR